MIIKRKFFSSKGKKKSPKDANIMTKAGTVGLILLEL